MLARYWQKLRHIVPVWLAIGVISSISLIASRALIYKYFPNVELRADLAEIWIPIAVTLLALALWLKPRIQILTYKKEEESSRWAVFAVASASLIVPALIAHSYLLPAISPLHEVDNLSQINPQELGNYYRIHEFTVVQDVNQMGAYSEAHAWGRFNEDLNLDFYVVFPLVQSGGNQATKYSFWYGLEYRSRIDNRTSGSERQALIREASEQTFEAIESHNFYASKDFEVVGASLDEQNYRAAIASVAGDAAAGQATVFIPMEVAYENRTGSAGRWILISAGIGFFLLLIFLISGSIDEEKLWAQKQIKPSLYAIQEFKKLFVPQDRQILASSLLGRAIFAVYLMMFLVSGDFLSFSGSDLLNWGANRRAEVLNGQWWRLGTSIFLHGGLMHIVANMGALLIASYAVEPVFGRVRTLVIFFLSGLCGSLSNVFWYENTISVGASGAIFGLFGAALALIVRKSEIHRFSWTLWLMLLVFGFIAGPLFGVDIAAHLGGFLAGLIAGCFLKVRPQQSSSQRAQKAYLAIKNRIVHLKRQRLVGRSNR